MQRGQYRQALKGITCNQHTMTLVTPWALLAPLRGVLAGPEPCNSNSNSNSTPPAALILQMKKKMPSLRGSWLLHRASDGVRVATVRPSTFSFTPCELLVFCAAKFPAAWLRQAQPVELVQQMASYTSCCAVQETNAVRSMVQLASYQLP